MLRLMTFFALAAAITLGAVACASKPSQTEPSQTDPGGLRTGVPTSAVRAYADPATETLLQGLSENDVAKYARDGNTQFKAAVTQAVLDTVASQIKDQFGDYESKEFLSTEEQQGYIIVHYKAKFTKGELRVRMVFDQDHKVAGQFFE